MAAMPKATILTRSTAAETAADVARVLIVTGCALALVLAGPVLPL
ncbi:MAG: hypothetical protein VXY04_09750 [Pseudomonadota bacterium]|nr:hypothetical protein [Qipengyuania flava]MEC8715493.1 hypothetical protein [Pseudomonadota bacterium]MEC8836324.1 hypothetical protein [Pseudomonadota bacterium]